MLTFVLGAQKNRLIETDLLSTHNICFDREIRNLIFRYTLLQEALCCVLEQPLFSTGDCTLSIWSVGSQKLVFYIFQARQKTE